jgi:hypothetical protein
MGGCVLVPRTLSYAGRERLYNFEATARILLNGDLMFRAIFDFNELRVAKMTQSQPWRDEAPDNLLNCIA